MNKYGWKPDLPDNRDHIYSAVYPSPRLPMMVDLKPLCSLIEDQETIGSCVSQALVGNLEYLINKDKKQFVDLSRLFVYYNARLLEHSTYEDSGAMIRDGIKSLVKWGVCKETTWPYDVDKFADTPPPTAYKEALNYQALSYTRIIGLSSMLNCLAQGYPFVCGISVYDSFESDEVARTGIVPYPKQTERLLGGHAVMCVGYDQKARKFIMRNSWGTNWGMQGYFTIDFAYLTNNNLADDFWSIKRAENM